MATPKIPSEIQLLLDLLDRAYNRRSWHGTNLRGSVRSLRAGQASWRPAPDRHNIREIAVHAAYWKYAVRRRLLGEKRGSFALKGSNWFPRTGPASQSGWREDLSLLEKCHAELRAAVAACPPAKLWRTPPGSRFTFAALIEGAAAHDLYHAGQIQLLKRLAPGAGEQ
jgi:hypothetical protein